MIHSDPKSFNDAAEAAAVDSQRRTSRCVVGGRSGESRTRARTPRRASLAPSMRPTTNRAMPTSSPPHWPHWRPSRVQLYGTTIKRIDRVGGEVSGVVVSDAEGERTQRRRLCRRVGSYRRRCCPASALTHWSTPPGWLAPRCPARRQQIPAPKGSITDDEERWCSPPSVSGCASRGTAELNGFDTSLNTVRCEALTRRAKHHFPDLASGTRWNTGPAAPGDASNLPIIGQSKLKICTSIPVTGRWAGQKGRARHAHWLTSLPARCRKWTMRS